MLLTNASPDWSASAGEKEMDHFGRLAIEQRWLLRSLVLPRRDIFSNHAIDWLRECEPSLLDRNV